MNNIELKLEVKEKLSANLKTIAKEKEVSREQLSEEILQGYVVDNEDIWTGIVEQIKDKEDIEKARLRDEGEYKIKQLAEKQPTEKSDFLDLIIPEDVHYRLWIVAEQKGTSIDQLIIQTLTDFTDDYRELLEEKDKQKKERKETQKHQKMLQREKKARKKEKEKQKRKNITCR